MPKMAAASAQRGPDGLKNPKLQARPKRQAAGTITKGMYQWAWYHSESANSQT